MSRLNDQLKDNLLIDSINFLPVLNKSDISSMELHLKSFKCTSLSHFSELIIVLVKSVTLLDDIMAMLISNDFLQIPSKWFFIELPVTNTRSKIRKLFSSVYAEFMNDLKLAQVSINDTLSWERVDYTFKDALTKRIDLSNSKLYAAIVPYSTHAYCNPLSDKLNQSCDMHGSYMEMVNQLSSSLNFRYQFIELKSLQDESTYLDVYSEITELVRLEEIELTPWFEEDHKRAENVSESVSCMTTTFSAFTNKLSDGSKSLWWSFSAPFSNQVWVATVISLICSGMVLWAVEYFGYSTLEWSLGRCIWVVFISIVKQGEDLAINLHNPGKWLFGFWGLCALILSAYYTAFLFISLAMFDAPVPFHDLSQMISLVNNGNYKLAAVHHPLLFNNHILDHAHSSEMRKLSVLIKHQSTKLLFTNAQVLQTLRLKENWVVIQDSTSVANLRRVYCSGWHLLLESRPAQGRMLISKNSCLKNIFDDYLTQFSRFGLMQSWDRKHRLQDGCHFNLRQPVDIAEELGMPQMEGTFIMFSIGCATSFITLIIEYSIRKFGHILLCKFFAGVNSI